MEDEATYNRLACNPTYKFKKALSELLDEGSALGILNKKERAFLVPSAPRIPIMYYLPKIHKSLENPPGRPIISGIDSITSRIGKYIDEFLQPLVTQTPSYLRDTTQVLNLLSETVWREGYIMATADVNSLYTIISHEQGLEAVRFYLQGDSSLGILQKDFIINLIAFATTHNYFWFDGNYFLQK